MLRMPDPSKPFRVVTDASDHATGAALEQEHDGTWHPVAFLSKALNPVERNYPAYDKELLAIIKATEHWRSYLITQRFDVYTDHMPLRYLHTKDKIPRRHLDYLDWLSLFDFDVHYKPGRTNQVA